MKRKCILFVVLLSIALILLSPASAVTSIGMVAGDGQTATVGTAVAIPPSIIIMDGPQPISGLVVKFTVTGGGGSVSGATATTDGKGIATIGSWKMGTTAGTNTLTATNGSLTVTFTATGTAGAATQLVKDRGDNQSAIAGSAVAMSPSVKVLDAYNNPVKGKQVYFTISLGGGSVSPTTGITTGANGIATVSRWTLGSTAGINSLIATSGSLTPVTFTAMAIPVVSTPNITTIFPVSAANNGQQTIDITGTGFNGSTVRLTKTGQGTITGVVFGTDTATSLSRTFNLNGIVPGTWNLVVLNYDGGSVVRPFTVKNATAATVTGISPATGIVNTTITATITGTGFIAGSAKIRLYRNGNYISGVNSGGTPTLLSASFSLFQATPGTYDVCVLSDGTEGSKTCGPTFTIYPDTSNANGSIFVRSVPSGGSVYLDEYFMGYTPITLIDISPGAHLVLIQSTGYDDWQNRVTVTSGQVTTIFASLERTVEPTVPPFMTPPTVLTIVTVKPPTTTPTPALPADIALILGTACLSFIAFRKR